MDELRIARGRQSSIRDALDAASPVNPGDSRPFVGRVKSATGAGQYALVYPTDVSGVESEGSPPAFAADLSRTVPVAILDGAFAAGDYLVAKMVGDRWAATRNGQGGIGGSGSGGFGSIPTCYCTSIPTTLTMKSCDHTCNFGMFQDGTLVFQDPPDPFAPLNLGKGYFSTSMYHDAIADADFYYYLTCQYNQFSLTRMYPTSPYGSPFRDGILYTWLVGGIGNTCTPFVLNVGNAFLGSDLSCKVCIYAGAEPPCC